MKIITKITISLLSLVVYGSLPAQSYGPYTNYSNQNYPQSNYYSEYQNQHQGNSNPYYNSNEGYYSNNQQKYYDGNAPQPFDWSYHESWRDQRKSYFSGETQAEAYRKSHEYGKPGIGYDGDPAYLKMKNEYEKLKADNERYVAENNRIASRQAHERQEYYSRGGGGQSQKGKASREARQGGDGPYKQESLNYSQYSNSNNL